MLDRVITTDETWLFLFDPETKEQSKHGKPQHRYRRRRQSLQVRGKTDVLICHGPAWYDSAACSTTAHNRECPVLFEGTTSQPSQSSAQEMTRDGP